MLLNVDKPSNIAAFELTKTGSYRVATCKKEANVLHVECYDPDGKSLYRNALERITWFEDESLKVVHLHPNRA